MTSILILLAVLGIASLLTLVRDLRHGRVGAPPPPRYDWSTAPHSRPYGESIMSGAARVNALY